jgi:hypothetical protein
MIPAPCFEHDRARGQGDILLFIGTHARLRSSSPLYKYVGLCYGPSGVGKTLSARTYGRWDKVKESDQWTSGPTENPLLDTVFYTPAVINGPANIAADIRHARDMLKDLARRPLRMEKEKRLESIRRRDEEHQSTLLWKHDWLSEPLSELHPTYGEVAKEYVIKDVESLKIAK